MMNEDLWKQYDSYTAEVTANARKLGFAAAAVAWFFKTPDNQFPSWILASLIATVSYFAFDLLQFILAAIMLRSWTRKEEIKFVQQIDTIQGDYEKPWHLDYPAYLCWWIKLVCLLISFGLLGVAILGSTQKA